MVFRKSGWYKYPSADMLSAKTQFSDSGPKLTLDLDFYEIAGLKSFKLLWREA